MTGSLAAAPFTTQSFWSHRWTRTWVLGVLWGAAVASMEAMPLPLAEDGWPGFARLLFWNGVAWSLVGVCLAGFLEIAQWRMERPAFFACAMVVGTPLLSALASLAFSFEAGPVRGIEAVFPQGRDLWASFLYQAWIVAFYGGLFAFAWSFNQRGERVRAALGRARIARLESEAMLAEARIRALRGQLDPEFLLRAMQELERRVGRDAGSAEALLARLVAFLRLAMPALRSGTSTLAEELALARAYASLAADVDGRGSEPVFEIPGEVPAMPFPPLLLLPILESLAAAGATPGRCRVVLAPSPSGGSLAFHAPEALHGGKWLSDDLAYRLRVGLSTVFGSGGGIEIGSRADSGAPALVLRFALQAQERSHGGSD